MTDLVTKGVCCGCSVADAMPLGGSLLVGEAVGVACWNVAVRNMQCDALRMT
jgi:hypothetical protein